MRSPHLYASFASFAASLAILAVACSEDEPSGSSSSSSGGAIDGGSVITDAGEATEGQGATDAGDGSSSSPKTTSVEATINDVTRTLERAQFGVTKASDTLYVEAHEGGVAECPEKETPKRTLIVSDVPRGAPGDTFTKDDGVSAALIDFAGDQITATNPTTKASALTVTIVEVVDESSVELEIEATFPEGTARGRVSATYCAAMNE